ncbi:MAG: hypothetical protein ACRYFW_10480 [Janthinobacterium lividum]
MRRFSVQLMAALAEREVGSLLPDLPGTGESLVDLRRIGAHDWSASLHGLARTHPAAARQTVAIRGGALLEGNIPDRCVTPPLRRRWRLAPITGERLLRDLDRADAIGGAAEPGWPISPALRAMLRARTPEGDARTAGLADSPGEADVRLAGAPLWRLAEPGEDSALVAAAADDIAGWVER